ncbi:MAG TPA: putative 2-aminoethylphosphonate ABC transporter substrate-binding protein [Candidatus Competibacteraceae bacterium]|nr:MAG: putative 2-aminoethylphosphonate ABC transporter substrate-binding protein [Candidatus Competibacteraceae bacterium]HOB62598.1 putative 2-aminoethylphosphonate ABC transporter substrate-binding protein [Candidatus Competibacteraceae bacterium]HQA27553.1 putative 2-aminoethylphosphonate ABC transporter substrate-binding protein [Candidatus Competibacteraceae bacterium]HQD57460.1 putative 2-aminoethylphosphonate ABC transporter substrate-binding protein [Candidatus Competibacteraceae bacte
MRISKVFGALLLAGMACAAQAKTELLVYTAVEADELAKFKSAIEADYPDLDIKWVRDSTGIITAKLLAEKANPQADVVWGLAVTSLELLAKEGYFQPYAPKGVDQLDPQYVDTAKPPLWVGQRVWIASLCYNTVEAEKAKLPTPTSWADLTKPEFKGKVVMPNPSSSGTGFLDVSAWLQMWGEDKGWKYMDALHDNIAQYTHSGSKPCKMAAAGEVPVGISFAYRGAQEKSKGAPVEVIAPKEGLGWDLESFAIVKSTQKLEAAKQLADWSVSRKANELYNEGYAVVAMPGIAKPVPNYPEGIAQLMIKNNFEWAATHREAILAEWAKRYDGKSEPKK